MGARAVGPSVGEQEPLGKTPLEGNPSPEMTYLPTFLHCQRRHAEIPAIPTYLPTTEAVRILEAAGVMWPPCRQVGHFRFCPPL